MRFATHSATHSKLRCLRLATVHKILRLRPGRFELISHKLRQALGMTSSLPNADIPKPCATRHRCLSGITYRYVTDIGHAHPCAQAAVKMAEEPDIRFIVLDQIAQVGMERIRQPIHLASCSRMRAMMRDDGREPCLSREMRRTERDLKPVAVINMDRERIVRRDWDPALRLDNFCRHWRLFEFRFGNPLVILHPPLSDFFR